MLATSGQVQGAPPVKGWRRVKGGRHPPPGRVYDRDVDKFAGLITVSQQVIDEADAVAKSQGWDTLMAEINANWQTTWDGLKTAGLIDDLS